MLNSQELIARWRSDANAASPAGPLFVTGPFAEADIAGDTNTVTAGVLCESGRCGTICSGSAGHPCC